MASADASADTVILRGNQMLGIANLGEKHCLNSARFCRRATPPPSITRPLAAAFHSLA
jgi:hypothetical protein